MKKEDRQDIENAAYDGKVFNAAGMTEDQKRTIIRHIADSQFAARHALQEIERLDKMLRAVKGGDNVFIQNGDRRVIQWNGELLPSILDYKGLKYIHEALEAPQKPWTYDELDERHTLRNPVDPAMSDRAESEIERTDKDGKQEGLSGLNYGAGRRGSNAVGCDEELALKNKLKETLRAEAVAAKEAGDLTRYTDAKQKLCDIDVKFREYYGTLRTAKRRRRKDDPTARAVRKAVSDAIKQIGKHHKRLAAHLDEHLLRENGTLRYIGKDSWVT